MNNFHLLKMMCKWKKIKRLGVFFPEIIQSRTLDHHTIIHYTVLQPKEAQFKRGNEK